MRHEVEREPDRSYQKLTSKSCRGRFWSGSTMVKCKISELGTDDMDPPRRVFSIPVSSRLLTCEDRNERTNAET